MERTKKLKQLCSIARTDDEDLVPYLREFEAIAITIDESYLTSRQRSVLLLEGLSKELRLELWDENKWEEEDLHDFQRVLAAVQQLVSSLTAFRQDRGLPVAEPYQQATELRNVLQGIKHRADGDVVEALAIVINGLQLEPEQLERLKKMIKSSDDASRMTAPGVADR